MIEPVSLVLLPASGSAQDAELLAEFTARLASEGLVCVAGSPPAAGLCVILLPASPDLADPASRWEAALAAGRKHERPGSAQLKVLQLRPHSTAATAASGLATLPADGRAITDWPRREAAWDDVVRCLRALAARGAPHPGQRGVDPVDETGILVEERHRTGRLRRAAGLERRGPTRRACPTETR